MMKPSRVLLSLALMLSLSCGFKDAQKIAFIRNVTLAILNSTAPDSKGPAPVLCSFKSKKPTEKKPAFSAPPTTSCPKVLVATRCPKSLHQRSRETAKLTPLFRPEPIPLEAQAFRVRRDAERAAMNRLRDALASSLAKVRRSQSARQYVIRVQGAEWDSQAQRDLAEGMSAVVFVDPDPVEQDTTAPTEPPDNA